MRQKKNCYTSRKRMIRGLCENSMVRLPATGSRQIKFCILEVPGNRLPNTGSNMAELKKEKKKKKKKQEPGNRIHVRNDQPGRIRKQQYRSSKELY
ncbi:hypothetical protein V6N11_049833 [Hibiscus sabdariffa]|uniref:Uncharacterized protein n=1 Tax=Hibiscus sabdariffa TaxID=183260 RepID=A0ABR2T8F2_9ROSI